ncbi:RNA polymerase II transcription elongation factor-domain-containing protein [Xylariaceae sp. FL0662B]|nr:RNA polymerase II transcription elongation factor-domain-containing protein [Xylariaceae sp. FL0662B]
MASIAAGIVDPTKAGKYPVVLSDALLGKDPKEVFTGVRYNHKPALSSPTAPAQARIKPTTSSKKGVPSYDLSFQDDGGRYQYKGTRGAEDGQYVLIFDPAREVFVLHKVDSMFNMNLVQEPSNDNTETLRKEYPQLESHSPGSSMKAAGPSSNTKSAKDSGANKQTSKSRKQTAKADTKTGLGLVMPEKKQPPKPTANKRRPVSPDSEEESSDDDVGLTIENPGGSAPSASRNFSPSFIENPPQFSEFLRRNEEEEDDADGEADDDDDASEHFKLPSPINGPIQHINNNAQPQPMQIDEEEEEEEEMEDVGGQGQASEAEEPALDEMDLEAALMAELGEGDGAHDQESDVSEEE